MPLSWKEACSAHNNAEMLTAKNNYEPAKDENANIKDKRVASVT
jgi:hypothetical protein